MPLQIGTRWTVAYDDQNEAFAVMLPRSGRLVRSFVTFDGQDEWKLLELDRPFEMQLKVGEPLRFREIEVTHFLLKERWVGKETGDGAPVAVYILIVERGAAPSKGPIRAEDFFHIAWGMCTRDRRADESLN